MSVSAPISMRIHHGAGFLSRVIETVLTWHYRSQARHELARWTDRELHDIGLSYGDIAAEIDKPFWQA